MRSLQPQNEGGLLEGGLLTKYLRLLSQVQIPITLTTRPSLANRRIGLHHLSDRFSDVHCGIFTMIYYRLIGE